MKDDMSLGKRIPAQQSCDRLSYFLAMRRWDGDYASALSVVREKLANAGLTVVEETGSSRFKTNISSSDLDVAVCCTDLNDAQQKLRDMETFKFKTIRKSTLTTYRIIYTGAINGIEVDLMLMPKSDFKVLQHQLQRTELTLNFYARVALTDAKRSAYMDKNFLLYAQIKGNFLRKALEGFTIDVREIERDTVARTLSRSDMVSLTRS